MAVCSTNNHALTSHGHKSPSMTTTSKRETSRIGDHTETRDENRIRTISQGRQTSRSQRITIENPTRRGSSEVDQLSSNLPNTEIEGWRKTKRTNSTSSPSTANTRRKSDCSRVSTQTSKSLNYTLRPLRIVVSISTRSRLYHTVTDP